jgi:hypothetical protein
MDQLTLIVCSYHTPRVLPAMLQSFVRHHPRWLPQRLLLMENSTDEETAGLLRDHGVPFVRHPGDTHSVSLDKALYLCRTRYALVADTDVLFQKDTAELLDSMIASGCTLLGELVQSRGGYDLVNRIGPWLFLVNVEDVQARGIRYHDQCRVEASGSQGFFKNVPLQPRRGGVYFDVGSTFLCDVLQAGLKVVGIPEWVRKQFAEHYEGLSWMPRSGDLTYAVAAARLERQLAQDAAAYADIDIRGAFVDAIPSAG